jgi:hypothetical protein
VLRIMIFIECDLCNELLSDFVSLSDPRQASADEDDGSIAVELHSIRLTAEENGWRSAKDSTQHYCPSCHRS